MARDSQKTKLEILEAANTTQAAARNHAGKPSSRQKQLLIGSGMACESTDSILRAECLEILRHTLTIMDRILAKFDQTAVGTNRDNGVAAICRERTDCAAEADSDGETALRKSNKLKRTIAALNRDLPRRYIKRKKPKKIVKAAVLIRKSKGKNSTAAAFYFDTALPFPPPLLGRGRRRAARDLRWLDPFLFKAKERGRRARDAQRLLKRKTAFMRKAGRAKGASKPRVKIKDLMIFLNWKRTQELNMSAIPRGVRLAAHAPPPWCCTANAVFWEVLRRRRK